MGGGLPLLTGTSKNTDYPNQTANVTQVPVIVMFHYKYKGIYYRPGVDRNMHHIQHVSHLPLGDGPLSHSISMMMQLIQTTDIQFPLHGHLNGYCRASIWMACHCLDVVTIPRSLDGHPKSPSFVDFSWCLKHQKSPNLWISMRPTMLVRRQARYRLPKILTRKGQC